jgi:hypothetical protein
VESPLKTIALEGMFFLDEQTGKLLVQKDDGTIVPVEPELESLIGRQVQIAVMHVPPHGVQKDEWGLGSCQWRPFGQCPAGHHETPDRLLVFSQAGSLGKIEARWALSGFDGSNQEVPLPYLVGHYGRVVAATTDAVERMRDILTKMDPQQQVEVLTGQAGQLREALDRVRKATGSD